MKVSRILGLVAIVVMAAMALAGVSTASANEADIVLCELPEQPCANANEFPNPTNLLLNATNPQLLTNLGTVECERSFAELTLLNVLEKAIVGHLLSLSFEGNCHLGATACTITVNTLGLISFTKAGPLVAFAKSTGGTQVTVKCGSFISCKYGGEPLLTSSSTEAGVLSLSAVRTALTGAGFLCPSTAELDVIYVTPLGFAGWLEY